MKKNKTFLKYKSIIHEKTGTVIAENILYSYKQKIEKSKPNKK